MDQKNETVPVALWTLTAGVAVTLISLWYGQNHGLLPEQASEQAPLVDRFFDVLITIATALFIVVEGAIVFAMFKFRKRRNDDSDAEPIKGNLPLEAFWTAIPAVIVIGLGIYSVEVYRDMGGFAPAFEAGEQVVEVAQVPSDNAMATAQDVGAGLGFVGRELADARREIEYGFGSASEQGVPDVVVNVTGMQFAWLFEYPSDGIMTGELHVPIGQRVKLNLNAQDVIHSFWVPQFRLKQDAIPGKDTQLQFVATKTGRYPIVCAELCGSYHGAMRSELVVDSEEDYATWLADNRIASNLKPAAVAVDANALSAADYLAPYASDQGMDDGILSQLVGHHQAAH
ncbi:heme/copper-type cytochrome/quinol oxidase, subunit 2 [Rubidibacter lacunae KORDI 51-2]|uniref:Cytochrome c oxidase subunit 2 n=1 Tax=Rubidibacter lacunae KORDI 51-2 TaxID=582515 RepID=U5DQ84_9CHRO|nr:cytochrome c oxidase subunit II [Rubidibacter lacunae]ERN41855.1 heme/copper-type cytochrome/quinol oxidase, subunit 2 [Rubidibacter lacunae KORDI 51-2]